MGDYVVTNPRSIGANPPARSLLETQVCWLRLNSFRLGSAWITGEARTDKPVTFFDQPT